MQLHCHSFLLLLIKLIDFSYKTAFSPFYCIISPHPRKLGTNRAVETSRSRYIGYRRHRCRRYGVREGLLLIQVVFTKKVQMKRSVTGGETKAAAHKGTALVLRWLGARQRLMGIRRCSASLYFSKEICNVHYFASSNFFMSIVGSS